MERNVGRVHAANCRNYASIFGGVKCSHNGGCSPEFTIELDTY
jgi:hypothetical protein